MYAQHGVVWPLPRRPTDAVVAVSQDFYPQLVVSLKQYHRFKANKSLGEIYRLEWTELDYFRRIKWIRDRFRKG